MAVSGIGCQVPALFEPARALRLSQIYWRCSSEEAQALWISVALGGYLNCYKEGRRPIVAGGLLEPTGGSPFSRMSGPRACKVRSGIEGEFSAARSK